MKTSELTGVTLNWAVAKAMNDTRVINRNKDVGIAGWAGGDYNGHNTWTGYSPSTDWAQGGPIIEREHIELYWHLPTSRWGACSRDGTSRGYGPTHLIAAMRCFVASKLGDEVDVPKEFATAAKAG
jgi:hypothetical protein